MVKRTLFLMSKENMDVYRQTLGDIYDVLIVENGAQMMEMLDERRPDIILIDSNMLDKEDGYKAVAQIRSDQLTALIPIILIASAKDAEIALGRFPIGSVDWVTKPIVPYLLLNRIEISLFLENQADDLYAQIRNLSQMMDKQILDKIKLHVSFRKYLDPKLAETFFTGLTNLSDSVGERRHIAVLFADIRGFTSMAESFKDAPEVVVEVLNEYLELATKSVFDHGGSIDKFAGDSAMALFNGFVPQEDYIFRAACAALDVVKKTNALRVSLKERVGTDLTFGIGINCGEAIVGNLGPSFRKDYTAIGDTVNVAARLESQAGPSEILISKVMNDALAGRIKSRIIGKMPLKGKSETIEVFALEGIIG